MTSELRDRRTAEGWLFAGMCLTRLVPPSEQAFAAASPWLAAAHVELGSLPPPGVVADFGNALLGGARDLCPARTTADAKLRDAVRLYEDQVLGRLGADPRLDGACDAAARLPDHLKREAVAVLLSSFLSRIDYRAGISLSPGITRNLSERSSADLLQRGIARLHQPGEVLDALAEGYLQLVRATRHAGSLLTDADLFALENLGVLRTLTQRLALQQVAEVAAELESSLPRRVRRGARRGARVAARIEDQDTYPIGGFSSVSTSGSIENLVTSELIYMDDPASREVDLFDVRYVEGELLYYTRDESLFLRNRRELTFVLRPELAQARFKDPGARWQRLVIVIGLLLCLFRRLSDWLSEEALRFQVVFLDGALAPERELCTLALHEWIAKGMATIGEARTLEEVLVDAGSRARAAESDVVVVGMGTRPGSMLRCDPRVQVLELDVARAAPVLRLRGPESSPGESMASSWDGWISVLSELVERLV